ncbi:MAG TPA: methylated-DNA--[protein]-cysteine S-methyltransferase [Actinomycetota bacterium]|jgi:methylated-DNA-[protein]-cysteine S-methyltransferase|nr:methylated-DNA--[protein]-cysteine S-methyltransferase [Actinomycetota bacterium]
MRELRVPWTDELEAASRRALEGAVERARRSGLVDVAYASVDSPIGRLLVASTRRGLVRLAFAEESVDHVLDELALTISPRVLEDPKLTDPLRRDLDRYFEGRLHRFHAAVDWALTHPGFSRRVLEETARIPFGSVATYGDVARRAGSPRAARAAGNALHDNPVPIVVPCHRVVPSSGGIGKYGGQEWRKVFLLELEGAVGG